MSHARPGGRRGAAATASPVAGTRETVRIPAVNRPHTTLRPATAGDAGFLAQMLVHAVNWDPARPPMTHDAVMAEPTLAHYVTGWPRPGDIGVVAERDGAPVGAAWLRRFDADDPGYGFVADGVPELSIGVDPPHRGRGVGTALCRALLDEAAATGIARVSLSVEHANAARRLYERLGFRTHETRTTDVVMVRDVAAATAWPAGEIDWDERYDHPKHLFGTTPNVFLTEVAHLIPAGGRVLCVADGEGRNGVWLAERGLRVSTFDASARGVAKARALAAARGVALDATVADVATADWPDATFDAVVGVFIQFSLSHERPALFARVRRTLLPGGRFILVGYTPDQLAHGTGGPRNPDKLYEPGRLRDELADFDLEHFDVRERVLDEGVGHRGISAVVEVVARRRPADG